jgi:hypothetical protein
MLLNNNEIERALRLVGELIHADRERISIVIIGGAALNMLGIVNRATRDVDVVAVADVDDNLRLARPPQPLPDVLVRAVKTVARDLDLPENWLNRGPASQWDVGLPPGFAGRIQWRSYAALHVGVADRLDLIFFKLEASADQPRADNNRHFADLLALSPTTDELAAASAWVKEKNAGDDYHRIVDTVTAHAIQTARQ